MSGFALVAEFPLGTYRAHQGDGDLDYLPSIARLHAALLGTAVLSSSGEHDLAEASPAPEALEALQWLEGHPPSLMHVPETIINRNPRTIAYRDLGLIEMKKGKGGRTKKLPRPASESVALAGPIAWHWECEPPKSVRQTLAQLCPDVSHLGTAESPVRLRLLETKDAPTPTHEQDDAAEFFLGGGIDLAVATPGRTEALREHERTRCPVHRGAIKDRWGADEDEVPMPPPNTGVATVRYRSRNTTIDEETRRYPWSQAILIPFDKFVKPEQRVRWAVQAHRALVALVGNDVPSVLTGRYPEGETQPANHVALHWLPKGTVLGEGVLEAPSTLAVLLPSDSTDTDLEVVVDAILRLRTLRRDRGGLLQRSGDVVVREASTFWPALQPGMVRRWLSIPPALPESRAPHRRGWTMADGIALSIGLVWRDQLLDNHGPRWQVTLAEAARRHGVSVEHLWMVRRDPSPYVHRVNPGTLVRPYCAIVDLGDLAGPQAPVAIGQSRHLGGGFLYPLDRAVEEVDA